MGMILQHGAMPAGDPMETQPRRAELATTAVTIYSDPSI
ncbi:hypothetical protein SAMN04489740_2553 [Arthrobacter alpinus]|uniref:Uncharacterized protein n=1 Tax=Arthrobacter alpinus TaxID=656366 RepID=A0A1H5LQ97_9MICC|nr:hypothetical protein SAMN04489740_2553 [Arthrobacter alpinus]